MRAAKVSLQYQTYNKENAVLRVGSDTHGFCLLSNEHVTMLLKVLFPLYIIITPITSSSSGSVLK